MTLQTKPTTETEDVTGFVYCPPGWDEQRLRVGLDADKIRQIAMETYTDIAYIKEKNAIQIQGETHEDVYKAQTSLNTLFFPVVVKSKKQWARPDRPGSWGQRRDSLGTNWGNSGSSNSWNNDNNNQGGGGQGLRRMKSESAIQYNQNNQQQHPQQHQNNNQYNNTSLNHSNSQYNLRASYNNGGGNINNNGNNNNGGGFNNNNNGNNSDGQNNWRQIGTPSFHPNGNNNQNGNGGGNGQVTWNTWV